MEKPSRIWLLENMDVVFSGEVEGYELLDAVMDGDNW